MFFISLIIGFCSVLYISLIVFIRLTHRFNNCSRHLVGKVVIVTGGSSGIGFETAKNLAERGARLIITCNNEGQGITARDKIICATDNKDVHYRYLELASLASVRKFADEIIKTEKKLDILINNAGAIVPKNVKTEDGLSLGMQINHFGPFLLTNLLLPLLKSSAPSRIITVSSISHRLGKVDFENLNFEKESGNTFGSMKWYNNSKLCNVLMTVELARLLDGTAVTANCLHPGFVAKTMIAEKLVSKQLMRYFKALEPHWILSKSPWEGAQTSIYLAVSPEVSAMSGRYFAECRDQLASETARDTALAKKLWEVSEKLVKLK